MVYLLFLWMFAVLYGCGSEKTSVQNISDTTPKISVLPEIDQVNMEWLNAYNANNPNIGRFYTQNALLFSEKELYLQGVQAITEYYGNKHMEVKTIQKINTTYRVHLQENISMAYETGYLLTDKKDTYSYLIIWSQVDGKWLRELEAIARKTTDSVFEKEIDTAREIWVKLSNEHSALKLAEGAYSKDFVYFFRGTVYQGYENLAEAYSYMNDTGYSVNLKKGACVPVQQDMVYEIGEWTASGATGNYVIIWNKQPNGEWKVRLDSNW